MPIKQTTPDKAKEILDKDAGAIYVDVRSIPEFIQGHADGAINIPIMHMKDGQMAANPKFPVVAQAVLPKEKTLVVGCKMGGRSQRACEILERVGYSNLFNIQGGFDGSPTQEGWKTLGLPVSTDNGDEFSYESLEKKVK